MDGIGDVLGCVDWDCGFFDDEIVGGEDGCEGGDCVVDVV